MNAQITGDHHMTYEEFVAAYESALREMFRYEINQVGSFHFCEIAAGLAEDYPEFMERYDN